MNKREKEVLQSQLYKEKAVLEQIKKTWDRSLNDINQKTKLLMFDIQQLDEALNANGLDDRSKEVLESQKRAKIYQKQQQDALQKQVAAITEKLHSDEYSTIEQYLKECYTDAYVGTMYDIAGQGIPIITPIDQVAVVRAVTLDSKISEGLYKALGVDTKVLKTAISAEISRGIATGQSYAQIAKNLNNVAQTKYSNAVRIVRTEGHRIQQQSSFDAQQSAKKKGCDVLKQWDAALDGRTRDTHRALDGQIREVDEPFEANGKSAMYPGGFGDPSEDCNCRCTSNTRARWALDEDELQTLKERAKYFELDKTKDFDDFKKKYLSAAKTIEKSHNSSTIQGVGAIYPEYSRLLSSTALYNAEQTNPHFGSLKYEYTHNCQRCVPAWELRERGFDVQAMPCKSSGEHDSLATSPYSLWQFNPFDQDRTKRIQADREGNGKAGIIQYLKECGNGARCEIVVEWSHNDEGHAFCAKNIDGKIVFIDPQSGRSGDVVEEYFERVIPGRTTWLRIDTLEMNESFRKDVIRNPYEKD